MGITFKDAQFPTKELVDTFYKAGASLVDCSVGEGETVSRKQPKPVQVAATTPAEIASQGPLSPKQRADQEAADIRAMLIRGR